jgi:hypothetical protein
MPADPPERRATAGAAMETDPLLVELSGRHRRLVWPLVALFLAWYLLLMLLPATCPGRCRTRSAATSTWPTCWRCRSSR